LTIADTAGSAEFTRNVTCNSVNVQSITANTGTFTNISAPSASFNSLLVNNPFTINGSLVTSGTNNYAGFVKTPAVYLGAGNISTTGTPYLDISGNGNPRWNRVGSSIDLAKGVALLATHDGPLEQYAVILGGLNKITSKVAPVIAIPTTAGTGSEVGRGALISLNDGRKLGFISPHLIPKIALCDPLLTISLPPRLTAATGMDALTHCIETFLSPRVNPPADAIALDGAQRAAKWIEIAFKDGQNQEARWNMMMASLQGGLTFQKGLGAVHSMSHPLGGLKNITLHHGTLNALILPAVLRFNREYCKEKLQTLELCMGIHSEIRLEDYISNLNQRLGLPISLSAMGVTREMLPKMIEGAVNDHSTATNPRPLNKEDFVYLFDQVF
jgi:alcohol dehydrogenase class IV